MLYGLNFANQFWVMNKDAQTLLIDQQPLKICNHRYRKAKIDCLSLFMCPLLAQLKIGFFSSFSATAVYSTNKQTRQALSSL